MSTIGLCSITGVTLLVAGMGLAVTGVVRRGTGYILDTLGWAMLGISDLLNHAPPTVPAVEFLLALLAFDNYRRHKDDDDDDTRGRRLRAWSKAKLRSFAPVKLRPIERSSPA